MTGSHTSTSADDTAVEPAGCGWSRRPIKGCQSGWPGWSDGAHGNFGWRIKEGSFCFDPNGGDPGFVFDCGPGDAPDDLIDPIAEYDHDEGIAVVGGFVYRGEAIPSLRGR